MVNFVFYIIKSHAVLCIMLSVFSTDSALTCCLGNVSE